MMEQREKLIELLKQDPELFFDKMGSDDYENLADHLIANGVVVLPCRCGECEHHDDCICVVCEDGETVVCSLQHSHVDKNGFCNKAKRKGGDE